MTFIYKGKALRERYYLSQKELEKMTGIPQCNICSYETQRRTPGLKTLGKLTRALNCGLDDLLEVANDE